MQFVGYLLPLWPREKYMMVVEVWELCNLCTKSLLFIPEELCIGQSTNAKTIGSSKQESSNEKNSLACGICTRFILIVPGQLEFMIVWNLLQSSTKNPLTIGLYRGHGLTPPIICGTARTASRASAVNNSPSSLFTVGSACHNNP